MILEVELHKALFGKDKIQPSKWEKEFLEHLWVSYLNVGRLDKITYMQREKLIKTITKHRSKKKTKNSTQ